MPRGPQKKNSNNTSKNSRNNSTNSKSNNSSNNSNNNGNNISDYNIISDYSNHSFKSNAKLHNTHVSEDNYCSRVVLASKVMHTDRPYEPLYVSAYRTFLHRPAGPTEYHGVFVLERWRLEVVLPLSQYEPSRVFIPECLRFQARTKWRCRRHSVLVRSS